jgi:hypothetical protein
MSGNISLTTSYIDNYGAFYAQMDTTMNGDDGIFQNEVGATLAEVSQAGFTNFLVPVFTAGTVSVNNLGMHFGGNLYQTGGVVDLAGGTIDLKPGASENAFGTYNMLGGKLNGSGTISNGNLINYGGTVEVIDSLTVGGSYYQGAGTLQMDATGDDAFAVLSIGTNAGLGGTLVLNEGGYNFTAGETYTIISISAGVQNSGSSPFDRVPDGWHADYLPNEVAVWFVPPTGLDPGPGGGPPGGPSPGSGGGPPMGP